jgi:uncharacterized protein YajQ (UPF0234 family)
MAQEHTFDIVSTLDAQELKNATQQASRELGTRYDFKGSKATIEYDGTELKVTAEDDYKVKSAAEMLQTRLVKRSVPLKALNFHDLVDAGGSMRVQRIEIQQGIPKEKAREVVKHIKGLKLKVQAAIQDDQVRVSGKKIDDLRSVMDALKSHDFGIHMDFANFR